MWVAYGHGNLLSAQSRKDPRSGDGLLTTFTFSDLVSWRGKQSGDTLTPERARRMGWR